MLPGQGAEVLLARCGALLLDEPRRAGGRERLDALMGMTRTSWYDQRRHIFWARTPQLLRLQRWDARNISQRGFAFYDKIPRGK